MNIATCFGFAFTGVIFATVSGGCQPLPAGDIAALRSTSAQTTRAGRVCLFRGWQDLYSEGIDRLAANLRQAGINAAVFRANQWPAAARAIEMDDSNRAALREPLVLIGFSYGADDAILIARELAGRRIPIDLLITIDPVTPRPVPGNVRACYDYFQTNGVWDTLPWLRGVPLKSAGAGRLVNVDLRRERPDLLEANTAHSTIAANPKLHSEIVRRVLAACAARRTSGCKPVPR